MTFLLKTTNSKMICGACCQMVAFGFLLLSLAIAVCYNMVVNKLRLLDTDNEVDQETEECDYKKAYYLSMFFLVLFILMFGVTLYKFFCLKYNIDRGERRCDKEDKMQMELNNIYNSFELLKREVGTVNAVTHLRTPAEEEKALF